MTDMTGVSRPAHRDLWSGQISDDPAAEVGVLGVPFDGAGRPPPRTSCGRCRPTWPPAPRRGSP